MFIAHSFFKVDKLLRDNLDYIIFTKLERDKSTKYINITGRGHDEQASKAILIWRQMSNINLKINNNSLEIRKKY